MGEALGLGTRVGVLDEGRLIACDSPDAIGGSARGTRSPGWRRAK
jgi:hypothetical protein